MDDLENIGSGVEADPEADVNAKYAQIIDRGEQVSGMKKIR